MWTNIIKASSQYTLIISISIHSCNVFHFSSHYKKKQVGKQVDRQADSEKKQTLIEKHSSFKSVKKEAKQKEVHSILSC